jgi:hypothetical protein
MLTRREAELFVVRLVLILKKFEFIQNEELCLEGVKR